jgi:transcriptional regulator of arginine metabolism
VSAAERRAALAAILQREAVASQEALAARLREAGHDVTQATVSRDLEALGAIRGKGGYRVEGNGEALGAILDQWRLSAEAAGRMVIVRTRPGSAHVVAAALDEAALPEIAGTIAGDDTLFIAVRDPHSPSALAERLGRG